MTKKILTPKGKAIIKAWLLGIAAGGVFTGITMLVELAPVYEALIIAATVPIVKWANKYDTSFGRGSK